MTEQPPNNPDTSAPDTMRYWLARTLRNLREAKGVSRDAIRMLVPGRDNNPMDPSTLSRFENGQTWPRELDALVAAYAALCGVEDGRELWANALHAWRQHGRAPALGDLSPQMRSVLLALEASRRTPPYAGESQDKPTSIQSRTRRAGGSRP